MQLNKIYKFAWQGSKVVPDNLKNSIIENSILDFFFNLHKLLAWPPQRFTRYAQFSSFWGHLDPTDGAEIIRIFLYDTV